MAISKVITAVFLSTLSLRRATGRGYQQSNHRSISIHALLAESDNIIDSNCNLTQKFLSTLSLRRATARRASRQQPAGISIHALLAESDNRRPIFFEQAEEFLSTLSLRRATAVTTLEGGSLRDFYPRSPCGERLRGQRPSWGGCLFLSTLSLRRATTHCKTI